MFYSVTGLPIRMSGQEFERRKLGATSASLGVCHRFTEVAVVAVGTVVTVSAGGVVPTLDTDSAAATSRQKVELLVEATATCVKIATTC